MVDIKGLGIDTSGSSVMREIGAPNTHLANIGKVSSYIDFLQTAAPAISNANELRLYFDSTSKSWRASENAQPYQDIVGNIGGTLEFSQIAVGAATPNQVQGSSELFYVSGILGLIRDQNFATGYLCRNNFTGSEAYPFYSLQSDAGAISLFAVNSGFSGSVFPTSFRNRSVLDASAASLGLILSSRNPTDGRVDIVPSMFDSVTDPDVTLRVTRNGVLVPRAGTKVDSADESSVAFEVSGSVSLATDLGEQFGVFGAPPASRATTGISSAAFLQNTGVSINASSTFSGYTIPQVVQALINYGFLS